MNQIENVARLLLPLILAPHKDYGQDCLDQHKQKWADKNLHLNNENLIIFDAEHYAGKTKVYIANLNQYKYD